MSANNWLVLYFILYLLSVLMLVVEAFRSRGTNKLGGIGWGWLGLALFVGVSLISTLRHLAGT